MVKLNYLSQTESDINFCILSLMIASLIRIGDTTLKKVIQLEENIELQKSIKEYKAVVQALELVNNDSKYIFEEFI